MTDLSTAISTDQTSNHYVPARPTIFIPNYVAQNDYSDAESLGELVFMTKGVIINPRNLHPTFFDYFAGAKEGDMLMFSGSNIVSAIAYAEWFMKFPTSRLVLSFQRYKDGARYVVIELN